MLDSDLSLDFLRVVEQAAIACAMTMGQGDRHKSDAVAVEAMRKEMDSVPIDGTIVIGEGERDEAPMLYIGDKVGTAQKSPNGRSYPESYSKRAVTGATRSSGQRTGSSSDARTISEHTSRSGTAGGRASSTTGEAPVTRAMSGRWTGRRTTTSIRR